VNCLKQEFQDFLDKNNVFAVVGASQNPEKYGHKVFGFLLDSGFKTYPVNPKARQVLGQKCFASLAELPEKPDVVSLVVPPKVTEQVVKQAVEQGIKKVWMQPGSESKKAIQHCQKNGVQVVHGECVMAKTLAAGLSCPSCGKYLSCSPF
jgi:hypothetical protein